jgi:hypothetical protein
MKKVGVNPNSVEENKIVQAVEASLMRIGRALEIIALAQCVTANKEWVKRYYLSEYHDGMLAVRSLTIGLLGEFLTDEAKTDEN